MQKQQKNSIPSARGFGLIAFVSLTFLSACGSSIDNSDIYDDVNTVEIQTIEIPRPAPIVPQVDQLQLRPIEWKIITIDNAETVFTELGSTNVLFAMTANTYESLSLNLSDLRSLVQQQKEIILIYENSYNDEW